MVTGLDAEQHEALAARIASFSNAFAVIDGGLFKNPEGSSMSAASTSTIKFERIYVKLTDEVVDVWRPVYAENVGHMKYRISSDGFNPEIETWEFSPGETVKVELQHKSQGQILVAIERV